MKAIMDLVQYMDKEIECAEKYYKCALYYKEENQDFSRKFADLSKQELNHALVLHDMAVEEINKAKAKGISPTQTMKDVWDEAHVEYISKIKELEYKISRL